MMKQINLSEAAGKEVRKATIHEYPSMAIMVFTDDTFALLSIERGYDPGDEEITDMILPKHGLRSCRHAFLQAGVLTEAEADRQEKNEIANERRRWREQEQRQLADLKKKYPEKA